MEVSIPIIKSAIALIIAIIGSILILSLRKLTHRQLCALISFSAGILLSVNIFTILPESYEMSKNIFAIAIAFVFGYGLFYLIGKYVFHVCPACSATHTQTFVAVSILMIVAFSTHSFLDGVGIAIESEEGLVFIAVVFHKLPEGLALTTIGIASNFSKMKTLAFVFLIETTTIIGAFIGIFFSNIPLFFAGIILSFIGGGFLYLVIHAMLGEMFKHEKKSILTYATIGFVMFGMISFAVELLG